MNRSNLRLISQPAWKVLVVDFVARALGLLVHVEGIPIGSGRNILPRWRAESSFEGWGG